MSTWYANGVVIYRAIKGALEIKEIPAGLERGTPISRFVYKYEKVSRYRLQNNSEVGAGFYKIGLHNYFKCRCGDDDMSCIVGCLQFKCFNFHFW